MNILFDLDDTLHDKKATLRIFGDRLYNEFNLQQYVEESLFTNLFLTENIVIQPKDVVFNKLAKEFGFSTELEQKLKKTFDETFHNDAVLFDGVLETLDYLISLDVILGCVTNGREFFQRNKIEALGLTDYFRVIVTSGELGIKKPDYRIFREALTQIQSKPENVVFCGDSLKSDIQPAKELGMATIWKSNLDIISRFVDFKLRDFKDLPSIWQAITKV